MPKKISKFDLALRVIEITHSEISLFTSVPLCVQSHTHVHLPILAFSLYTMSEDTSKKKPRKNWKEIPLIPTIPGFKPLVSNPSSLELSTTQTAVPPTSPDLVTLNENSAPLRPRRTYKPLIIPKIPQTPEYLRSSMDVLGITHLTSNTS